MHTQQSQNAIEESEQQKKYREMTQTPVRPLICRMAVPTIISMMISSIYNMADTFFVGGLGTSATGAVGIAFSLMAVIKAIGFFFGQGSGNYMSRKLGARCTQEAARMSATGFFTALGAGCVILALGELFLEPMCRLLGATETILPYAMDYIRLILLGAPYMTAALVLNVQLRMQGNAFYAMIGLMSGGLLNIVLDPLFIFQVGMGVSGAALATILSQLVSFLLLLRGTFHGGNVRIQLRLFSPSASRYKAILGGGLPSLCRQSLSSFATICLNTAAGPFGDAAIAAMSIVTRVSMFASSAMLGFGQGFQPVCGFNYGAKRFDRVRQGFWFCVTVAAIVLTAFAVLGYVFAPSIVRVFRADDPAVIRIGTQAMRLQCLTFPLQCWIIPCNMMLQNIAKTVRASVLSMARQGLFFLPFIFLLPPVWGMLGVELCQPVADILSALLAVPMTVPVLQELKRSQVDLPVQKVSESGGSR